MAHILIIDDEPSIRKPLQIFLERAGHVGAEEPGVGVLRPGAQPRPGQHPELRAIRAASHRAPTDGRPGRSPATRAGR